MMDKDVILMLDEIYLQKDEAYQGGHVIGSDKDGNLFKGITLFTILFNPRREKRGVQGFFISNRPFLQKPFFPSSS